MKEKKEKDDDDTIISLPSDEFSPVTLYTQHKAKKMKKKKIFDIKIEERKKKIFRK